MKSFLKTVFLMGLIVSIHLSPPCNAAQQFSPPPDFGGGMPQMAMPNQEEMEQAMKELEKNPQMMEELGREMEKLMQDPAFLDTMDQIMSDPEAMKQIEAQAKEFEKAFQKQEDNQKEKESGTDKPLEKKDAKLVGPKDVTIVSTTGDLKRDFLEPTPEAKQEDEKIQLPQDKWDAFHYYIGAIISSLNRIMGKINSFALGIEAQDKLQFLEKDITKLKISFGILSSKKL
ncbi:hypothetical protein KAU11_04855, partial [Candidatus Babeliales bacterium]|nr:hypothetical protein [Candidatus Babeliales bacterium]